MAQRTGAERFLASPAKGASAGVILALALAALCLPGCGGGSSDPASSSSTSSSSVASAAEDGGSDNAATVKDKAGEKASQPQSAAGKSSSSAQSEDGSQGQQQSPHHKQGPAIAQPKGAPEQAPTPSEAAHATVADLSLQSPAIIAAEGHPGSLAATYTCDGKNSWPQLHWAGVPPGTAELVLFAMNLQPVGEKIFFDWAVAGLDPGLQGVEAGKLPSGAVVGTNGFGKRAYSICPATSGEAYMFAVYALPQKLSPQKGFDPLALRQEVLAQAGNVGLLPAIYARG